MNKPRLIIVCFLYAWLWLPPLPCGAIDPDTTGNASANYSDSTPGDTMSGASADDSGTSPRDATTSETEGIPSKTPMDASSGEAEDNSPDRSKDTATGAAADYANGPFSDTTGDAAEDKSGNPAVSTESSDSADAPESAPSVPPSLSRSATGQTQQIEEQATNFMSANGTWVAVAAVFGATILVTAVLLVVAVINKNKR